MVFIVDENHFSASLIPAVPLKSLCIMGKSGDLSPIGTQTWRKPQPGTQSSVASQAPSPCYGTLTWGKWPFKCRRFSQRGGQKKKNIQYLCCPLPSPETMRMVLVYYWKNRGLKEFSLFLWLHQICILIIGKGQVDHSPSPPLQHRQVGIPYAKQTVHVFPACYTPACQVNPEWNREPASSSP